MGKTLTFRLKCWINVRIQYTTWFRRRFLCMDGWCVHSRWRCTASEL